MANDYEIVRAENYLKEIGEKYFPNFHNSYDQINGNDYIKPDYVLDKSGFYEGKFCSQYTFSPKMVSAIEKEIKEIESSDYYNELMEYDKDKREEHDYRLVLQDKKILDDIISLKRKDGSSVFRMIDDENELNWMPLHDLAMYIKKETIDREIPIDDYHKYPYHDDNNNKKYAHILDMISSSYDFNNQGEDIAESNQVVILHSKKDPEMLYGVRVFNTGQFHEAKQKAYEMFYESVPPLSSTSNDVIPKICQVIDLKILAREYLDLLKFRNDKLRPKDKKEVKNYDKKIEKAFENFEKRENVVSLENEREMLNAYTKRRMDKNVLEKHEREKDMLDEIKHWGNTIIGDFCYPEIQTSGKVSTINDKENWTELNNSIKLKEPFFYENGKFHEFGEYVDTIESIKINFGLDHEEKPYTIVSSVFSEYGGQGGNSANLTNTKNLSFAELTSTLKENYPNFELKKEYESLEKDLKHYKRKIQDGNLLPFAKEKMEKDLINKATKYTKKIESQIDKLVKHDRKDNPKAFLDEIKSTISKSQQKTR